MVHATTSTNPVIAVIIAQHPAIVSFTVAAEIIGFTRKGAYTARARSQFPVRVRQAGCHLTVFLTDIVEYLTTGVSQSEQSVALLTDKYKRVFKVRTGRPSKRESLEAARLGVSVKELRAMAGKPVKAAEEVSNG